jgi:hypothetical protein
VCRVAGAAKIELAKEALMGLLTKENKPITGQEIVKVVAALRSEGVRSQVECASNGPDLP